MDFIKILVDGTNQEIKRKYFKLENSQNICYFDLSGGKDKDIKMVNLEDGFAIKNGKLVTSPPILKIRGTIIDVRMDTDSNTILIDSVEVSTNTAYTNVFEPYKTSNCLIFIESYVTISEGKLGKSINKVSPKKTTKFKGKERIGTGGLPVGWTPIQNGNTINLIDIAFDGGSDQTATHNLYAIASNNKFYQLNIKLDGSVNTPITGNSVWSELLEINTDLASFFANGFGSSSYPPILSAYGGVLILTFYSSGGITLPIFIPINRETPDWLSTFPLASSSNYFIMSGVNWPSYVRIPPGSFNVGNLFANPMIYHPDLYPSLWVGGKIGIAEQMVQGVIVKYFISVGQGYTTDLKSLSPIRSLLTKNSHTGVLKNTSQNKGWGEINNVFTDSTSYIIDSNSPNQQSNGIVLIDWQDSSYRHLDYWTFDSDGSSIWNLGTIQIPMGLGVLQFAAFNGVLFCLTTTGLYFMRYTDTIDGTTPIPNIARCCETGTCGSTTLLVNQLNLWTDCSSGKVCNYSGKNTCTGPAPPGPKPTPTPTPPAPPSGGGGFFSRIWNWIKEHWIISLTTVAVIGLIFILIIFIAVKSKQSSSLSGQFNQNLEILEQQKLASLLKPTK